MDTKKDKVGTENSLSDKFNLIEKIAKMLTKYGYKKVISSLFIFILFIATVIVFLNQKSIMDKIIFEQKKEQQMEKINHMKFRMTEVNPRVDAILYKLLVQTKATRAFIIEMHNGTDNPTGLPFVFGDMTYEKLSNDSLESVIFQYNHLNLSAMPMANYLIKNKKFIGTIEELSKIDINLSKKLDSNGAKFIIIYGLRTIDIEIGWVGLTYTDDVCENMSKVEGSVIDASQNLSILLDITNNIKQ